jgi:hypothetical protein
LMDVAVHRTQCVKRKRKCPKILRCAYKDPGVPDAFVRAADLAQRPPCPRCACITGIQVVGIWKTYVAFSFFPAKKSTYTRWCPRWGRSSRRQQPKDDEVAWIRAKPTGAPAGRPATCKYSRRGPVRLPRASSSGASGMSEKSTGACHPACTQLSRSLLANEIGLLN